MCNGFHDCPAPKTASRIVDPPNREKRAAVGDSTEELSSCCCSSCCLKLRASVVPELLARKLQLRMRVCVCVCTRMSEQVRGGCNDLWLKLQLVVNLCAPFLLS